MENICSSFFCRLSILRLFNTLDSFREDIYKIEFCFFFLIHFLGLRRHIGILESFFRRFFVIEFCLFIFIKRHEYLIPWTRSKKIHIRLNSVFFLNIAIISLRDIYNSLDTIDKDTYESWNLFFEDFLILNSVFLFLLNNVNYRFREYLISLDSFQRRCTQLMAIKRELSIWKIFIFY